jgi:hypothetical protein
LIRDEFAESIEQLREGIALNNENPALNRDMQLLIDQAAELLSGQSRPAEDREAASATSFLLNQFAGRGDAG